MFLREFVPETLRDMWHTEFERLRQGTMTVFEYAIRFSELARRAPTLVPTIREWVCRFIEGLNYDIKICMARELQTDTPFQQVVEIARRIEGVLGEEKVSKEIKRSRSSGGFSGFYSSTVTYYVGGLRSRPAQSAHQITRGTLLSGTDSVRAVRPQRGCYECGNTRPVIRDYPRLGRCGFHQNTQAMGPNAITTPRAQLVRSGGQAGRGRPRGGGPAR
uniref:Uncharacterized protein LOC104213843 n=1 Tax=Nicotiana sylvestris TaxID=4096 RepID=A0A1U7V0B5_NICSY|nr:PREDICTED: uncharacterized protein LOC104213843 [Nicotiana sylvestris]